MFEMSRTQILCPSQLFFFAISYREYPAFPLTDKTESSIKQIHKEWNLHEHNNLLYIGLKYRVL